ncbi:MAG: hypothetical protein ABRQ39_27715 [Candidatus Eremiobacterota bacterium]
MVKDKINNKKSEEIDLDELTFSVDKLDMIRTSIAGYAGGAAIARELVQNADDASADWIEFYFTTARLIVRNNSSFSKTDFEAISRIASGNKRFDKTTTGTWGTGFLSVYQITDFPEVYSSGKCLIFDPRKDKLGLTKSDIADRTEFHFSWRSEDTDISRHIEAEPWSKEKIQKFIDDIVPEIYRVILFLRNIKRISVYNGIKNPRLLYEVSRICENDKKLVTGAIREEWNLKAYDHKRGKQEDKWIFYKSSLLQGFIRDDGIEIKTPFISFACGPEKPFLMDYFPGTLYNFLPTGIHTGLPFHINGDFFPDTNRITIVADNSAKGDWNRKVINSIGTLFASNLEYIRDESSSPENFYRLLPVEYNRDFQMLKAIVKKFREKAKDIP